MFLFSVNIYNADICDSHSWPGKINNFIFQAILRLCPRHFRFQECAGKLPGLSLSIIPTLISHCHVLLAIRRVFICTFLLTIWILRYVLFLYVLNYLFKEIYLINLHYQKFLLLRFIFGQVNIKLN